MLKFQKVFAPTRKCHAGQNPGATKIPLPLRAGDKNPPSLMTFLAVKSETSMFLRLAWSVYVMKSLLELNDLWL